MFPEYRDLITRLKAENRTFARLFDEHNELDQRVKNIEARIIPGTDSEVEALKKEKLQLKDRLYEMLRRHRLPEASGRSARRGALHDRRSAHWPRTPGTSAVECRASMPLRVPPP